MTRTWRAAFPRRPAGGVRPGRAPGRTATQLSDFGFLDATVIAVAMFLGGIVKGTIGFGLPLVTVPIMTLVMAPATAIAIMAAPIFTSNLVQASGAWRRTIVRFWPLVLTTVLASAVGAWILSQASGEGLDAVVGAVLIGIAVVQLFGIRLPRPRPAVEPATSAAVGAVTGVVGGITSFYGPTVVPYLVALDLGKDEFVSTVASYYVIVTLPYFASLAVFGVLGATEFVMSLLALVPLFAGMRTGAFLRGRIPGRTFRLVILLALMAIGVLLIVRGLS